MSQMLNTVCVCVCVFVPSKKSNNRYVRRPARMHTKFLFPPRAIHSPKGHVAPMGPVGPDENIDGVAKLRYWPQRLGPE